MSTDEIVRALRWLAKETEFTFAAENLNGAADLIESLQAENERIAIHGGRYMQLADERYKMFERAIKRADDAETQLAASQRRERAAVEDMTAVLKRDSDDICAYCKNRVECESQQCEKYSSGVGDVDGNYPDWKLTCMDFAYGTCSLLADTPCNGCLDDDCKGFEWRGPQEAGKGEQE